ncbi:hypothetical protein [Streptomyces ureilyticus]|uniref:hypothetical protein n=1 Tax=Streptomyces ureilyticus TaxID=1775131 RepID=UPI002E293904|nr:hypothetical protein [Streptomyces ureilyticus]
MTALRWTLGTAGAVLLGIGGWLLVTETREDTVPQVLLWLAGAVAVHDGLLVPLVLLAGLALRRPYHNAYGKGDAAGAGASSGYGVLRGGLIVGGCLTLIALPLLLRQGQGRNPTALPLDYATNWQLLLAVTFAVTLALLPVRRLWGLARRPRGTPRE